MNVVVILLTVLAIMGLIAGIVLVASGKIAFAGVIWAVTVILTCIALRIERYRKNGGTSKKLPDQSFRKLELGEEFLCRISSQS